MKQYNPILITGVERSGSTLIAKILDLCGVYSGECNSMFENKGIYQLNNTLLGSGIFPNTETVAIPFNWHEKVIEIIKETDKPWMVKHSMLSKFWPVWDYAFPDAKWLIVRRRTGDVIQSCVKTGYMRTFKEHKNLDLLGFNKEEEGWLWWVHEHEKKFVEMIQAGLNCRIVWPERMVYGNYEQIFETVEWLGLKWNSNIPKIIDPLLNKSREVMYENVSK